MNQSSTPSPEKWLFLARAWWCIPNISALGRSMQENSLEFKPRVKPYLKKKSSKKSTNKQTSTPAHCQVSHLTNSSFYMYSDFF